MTIPDAHRAAEHAARTSYGRLVAVLVAQSRDIMAAEDALSEAFIAALRTWPINGVPDNPDAWLLTAARNRYRNVLRHDDVATAAAAALILLQGEGGGEASVIPFLALIAFLIITLMMSVAWLAPTNVFPSTTKNWCSLVVPMALPVYGIIAAVVGAYRVAVYLL